MSTTPREGRFMSHDAPQTSIVGIGIAVPTHRRSQNDIGNYLINHLDCSTLEKRRLKRVFFESGIDYRHSVLASLPDILTLFNTPQNKSCQSTKERMLHYKKAALPLALEAIDDCFNSTIPTNKKPTNRKLINRKSINRKPTNTNLQAKITHLITVSCTGMYAPGLDIEITQALGIPTTVKRTCINFMGCYGVFNALKCADSICKADSEAQVLIVSVELCSLHFQNIDTIDNLISSTIFSDGAGALLVQSTKLIQSSKLVRSSQLVQSSKHEDYSSDHNHFSKRLIIQDFYCNILSKGIKEMTWDISNHGFDIALSSYVPALINGGILEFIQEFLTQQNMQINEFQHYAIHPGGKKILEACQSALGLNAEKLKPSYDVLREYGNMSSATIVFVLKKIWDTLTNESHNQAIYSCAFGPGLTLESMILKACYEKNYHDKTVYNQTYSNKACDAQEVIS